MGISDENGVGIAEVPGRHPATDPGSVEPQAGTEDAGAAVCRPSRIHPARAAGDGAWHLQGAGDRRRAGRRSDLMPPRNVVDSRGWLEYLADGPSGDADLSVAVGTRGVQTGPAAAR